MRSISAPMPAPHKAAPTRGTGNPHPLPSSAIPSIGSTKKQTATYGPQNRSRHQPQMIRPTMMAMPATESAPVAVWQRHAAIGEERDDMNDGAVDRQNAEKECDREQPEVSRSQRCSG